MSEPKKALYGYCAVTADFLHIGHLRLFQECKKRCYKLMVGVMTDECVESYKGKKPIMKLFERFQLVGSIKCVNSVWIQDTFEFDTKILGFKELYGENFIIFDNEKHNRKGADVLIPYMEGISSTTIKKEYIGDSEKVIINGLWVDNL